MVNRENGKLRARWPHLAFSSLPVSVKHLHIIYIFLVFSEVFITSFMVAHEQDICKMSLYSFSKLFNVAWRSLQDFLSQVLSGNVPTWGTRCLSGVRGVMRADGRF